MRRLAFSLSNFIRRALFPVAFISLLFVPTSQQVQSGLATAQTQSSAERIELQQALLDLTNIWTVMCVAAHPDDEDGATLTVLRRKYGVHTVSLFSTFGEGGQNAIGPELYEELGAIRAQETLRASAIQGSEPHFLGLKDFGFSKSAEEAFRIWGHEEALSSMVLQIRMLQPDVIITNHDTTSGHGHHQATGRLVLEAFIDAADPYRFPEQLHGWIKPWQTQRLFVRVTNDASAGSKALEEDATRAGKIITIDRNEVDPVRGSSYAEQALNALQQHASQGPWPKSLPKDGWPPVRYRLVREARNAAPLPTHASTFFEGLRLPGYLDEKLAPPTIDNRPLVNFVDQRERVFKAIATARTREIPFTDAVQANQDKHTSLMAQRTEEALAEVSGISASFVPEEKVIIPGEPTTFVLNISNRGTTPAMVQSVLGGGARSRWSLDKPFILKPQSTYSEKIQIRPSQETAINLPKALHLYDEHLFGEEFNVIINLKINGVSVRKTVKTFVDVAPAVEILGITPSPYVFTPANVEQPMVFKVAVVNRQNKPFKGDFGITRPGGTKLETGPEIALAANETREFTIRTNMISIDSDEARLTPGAYFGDINFSVRSADRGTVITQRDVRVNYSDVRVAPDLRVGYVPSYDDSLRNAFATLGVEAHELTLDDIRNSDLQKYDTIVIDNRGYQAHPELIVENSRLMDFTKNGGTLVVFYHKRNEWNPDSEKNRQNLAPYPLTLGDERVTEETASVTLTEPLHQLLNTPNKIGQADFKDWIQERGLYYPKSWDPRYHALLEMGDKGEQQLRGGLLVADYGLGHYIYTSMVWYRQLRGGIPGGYRMFANMISYGKSDRAMK